MIGAIGSAGAGCCNIVARSLDAAIVLSTTDGTGMKTCVGTISVCLILFLFLFPTSILYNFCSGALHVLSDIHLQYVVLISPFALASYALVILCLVG